MTRLLPFLCVHLGGSAWAQYPEKPVHLLLTFASGGQADILARLVTDRMRASLGQPIIIEPKPGAGGNLAMEAAAKAPADGYTLVLRPPRVRDQWRAVQEARL